MTCLVSKTVRLPEDLVKYVESQYGDCFAKKLVHILEEHRAGEKRRQEILREYDRQVEEKRKLLGKYADEIRAASNICREISRTLKDSALAAEAAKREGHFPRGPD